jgi:predicted AlkP superfamily pyrophosphatase or phosphodiesterase
MHGVLGYELWLKEYGIVANMIEHKPITYSGRSGNLSNAGFSPDNFLFGKSIATHFKEYGIKSHVFQHYSIINSGLSRSFMQDAELHAIGGVSDMWVSARELMESQQNDKKFVYVYWPAVDSLSHFHGPENERVFAEFKLFSSAFEQLFIDQLSQEAKKDTLVILTADHGQITTDKQIDDFDLKNHPAFLELLTIKPTGENRLPYLYIKPGRVEEVKQYINSKWSDQFLLLDPKAAVENGFFGPGEPHKMIYERIGDLIVIPRGDSYWWWSNAKNPLTGRHGGLSRDEMLVPFLAFEVE